jgi:hypothetical protein
VKLSLSCDCCAVDVRLSRDRFLRLVRADQKPLCEQCRRYVLPGTARKSQPVGETADMALRLVPQAGKGAKRVRPLASCKLKRVGGKG